jgi:hypothetical protein
VSGLTGASATGPASITIGVPLEFPVDLLPAALARLTLEHPDTKVTVLHSSSATQLSALQAGELDVALVRDRPADSRVDAVLAVEESMGVILTRARSAELAEPAGVRLQRLAGLEWIAFARSDSPAWHDQVTATLRGHGIALTAQPGRDNRPVTVEAKLASAGSGRAFAFASPGWAQPLPDGLLWHPLIGQPIVRRTWAVWQASAHQRELAALIAILDSSSA